MVHVIVGYGEVGKALHKVLGKKDVYWCDRTHSSLEKGQQISLDVVHFCIPYLKDDFESTIKEFQSAKLIIVHSSVPVGTCDALGVVHSPIRGVHPHLEEGIRTFVKYFGGKNATKAAKIFSDLGLRTRTYTEAKTTEAIKLWDTTQYGKLIMLEKQIYKWCQKNDVDFKEVYQNANKDYNVGYVELGRPEVVRPHLKHIEGPIGGHCVTNNAKLLKVKL